MHGLSRTGSPRMDLARMKADLTWTRSTLGAAGDEMGQRMSSNSIAIHPHPPSSSPNLSIEVRGVSEQRPPVCPRLKRINDVYIQRGYEIF